MKINVIDVNDNPPRFIHRVFTGGVSTGATFGTEFMTVKVHTSFIFSSKKIYSILCFQAKDADIGENADISYYLIGNVQMTLTEGLDNLQRSPFLVDRETGGVQLNFDPQQGMKGYFDFVV